MGFVDLGVYELGVLLVWWFWLFADCFGVFGFVIGWFCCSCDFGWFLLVRVGSGLLFCGLILFRLFVCGISDFSVSGNLGSVDFAGFGVFWTEMRCLV